MGGRSGFVSGGRAFGAGVVSRPSASGAVWSWRAPVGGVAAPGSVCVGLSCPFALAQSLARAVAGALPGGWSVVLRRPKRAPAFAWEIKVAFPPGVRAQSVRSVLASAGLVGV